MAIESNNAAENNAEDFTDIVQRELEIKNEVINNIDKPAFLTYIENLFKWTPFDAKYTLNWFKKPENSLKNERYNIIIKYLDSSSLSTNEKIEFIIRLRDNLYKLKPNETEINDGESWEYKKYLWFMTALNNAHYNKKFSEVLFESCENIDEKSITTILFNYIEEWKDISWDIDFKDQLWNPITIEDENLKQILLEKNYIIKLDELPDSLKRSILTIVRERLNEKIKEFSKEHLKNVNNEVDESIVKDMLKDGYLSNILEQYNYIQKFFKTPTSIKWDRNKRERLKAILSRFGYKVINVDKRLLEEQQREEERIREANKKRIEWRKKRNQEINEKFLSQDKENSKTTSITDSISESEENNEWIQKLKDSNIEASQLDSDRKIFSIPKTDELYLQYEAFDNCFKTVFGKQWIITKYILQKMYDIKNMKINYKERDNIKTNLIKGWISENDIKSSEELLGKFDNEAKLHLDELKNQYFEDRERINDSTKLTAAWDVINSITYIFNSIWDKLKYWPLCEGFKYAEDKPIKIIWENMLISWTLNGEEIIVKYNMSNWELFMNSSIRKNRIPNMYIIWDKDPDFPLPKIDSFTDILNKHGNLDNLYENAYQDDNQIFKENHIWHIPQWHIPQQWHIIERDNRRPWIQPEEEALKRRNERFDEKITMSRLSVRPRTGIYHGRVPLPWLIWDNGELSENNKIQFEKVLWNTLDVIGEKVKNHINEYSTINNVVDKFFNTIVPNYNDVIFVQEWSNIFNTLECLNNTDNIDLEYFNRNFMPKIMEYSWMEWWKYTEFQNSNKIQVNNKNISESPRANFVNNIENFTKDSQKLWMRLNYDSTYNHSLASILNKITEIDGKFTKQNMEKYIDELENDKYIWIDEELDKKLSEL